MSAKKAFSQKCFLDSNMLIYAFDKNDSEKMDFVSDFLHKLKQNSEPIISTQTLGEFFNVATKKLKLSKEIATAICEQFVQMFPVYEISTENVLHAMKISKGTQFSYWDSLILAVAIDSGCSTVYSEDLSDGQIVEGLRIVNPFSR